MAQEFVLDRHLQTPPNFTYIFNNCHKGLPGKPLLLCSVTIRESPCRTQPEPLICVDSTPLTRTSAVLWARVTGPPGQRATEPQSHRATEPQGQLEPQNHRATGPQGQLEPQGHRASWNHRATGPQIHRATGPAGMTLAPACMSTPAHRAGPPGEKFP